MLPNVTFDYDSRIFTFTLWRNEKEVIHELKGTNVFVDVMPDKAKDDGNSYFIYVQPYQGEDFEISLSKDEFDILDPIMFGIEEDIYHDFYECEFTRTTLKDMEKNPTKYGPEQLARAGIPVNSHQSDEDDYEYDGYHSDTHDAYREHPLDHE